MIATNKYHWAKLVITGILIVLAIIYLIPYIWMISMSFKPDSELFGRAIFPQAPTLEQYRRLFFGYQFKDQLLTINYLSYYLNTTIITVVSLVLVIFTDSLAAYTFAKFEFKGKGLLFWLMIGTMMLPVYTTIIPTYWLFSKFQLVNTYAALILPGVIDAYGIFLLRQYMLTIPNEILDAARVDGAGPFRRYWQIILPLCRPALATLAILRFLFTWNDYFFPLVMMRKEEMYTLTLGIANMRLRQGMVVWGSQMAASVLATLPVILLVLIMQRHFLRGLTAGSFKG